jgi:hypothetical protein
MCKYQRTALAGNSIQRADLAVAARSLGLWEFAKMKNLAAATLAAVLATGPALAGGSGHYTSGRTVVVHNSGYHYGGYHHGGIGPGAAIGLGLGAALLGGAAYGAYAGYPYYGGYAYPVQPNVFWTYPNGPYGPPVRMCQYGWQTYPC